MQKDMSVYVTNLHTQHNMLLIVLPVNNLNGLVQNGLIHMKEFIEAAFGEFIYDTCKWMLFS